VRLQGRLLDTGGRTMKWLKVKQPEYRVKERGFYDPDRS
jgi:hypothetical protein